MLPVVDQAKLSQSYFERGNKDFEPVRPTI